MRNLVKHLTNYYCGGEKSVVVGAFYAEMDVLREGIATLSGDLSDSWWEGSGLCFFEVRVRPDFVLTLTFFLTYVTFSNFWRIIFLKNSTISVAKSQEI